MTKLSSAFKPRTIKPSSIRIGDTVRVTWKSGDLTCSHVGVVAARDQWYGSVSYQSASGRILLEEYADGTRNPYGATVTLLVPAPEWQTPLEGLKL